MDASVHPVVGRYEKHVNPAFVRMLGTFGYGRVFVRGRGCTLWDDTGREYLDMLAGFGAVNLGHNPPELIERLQRFLGEDSVNLLHVGPQPHAADLAEHLASLLPEPLEVSLFSNSGGEAVEAALKLARAATGRPALVYCHGGYHGTGLGALSVLGHARLRAPFEPLLPDCHAIPFNDLAALERALEKHAVAGFLVEPVQGEAGVILPEPGYLLGARELCRRHGALFMLDEVQTGLGRTGRLFAFEHWGVTPDVLVLGKALGGSLLPVSATVTSRELQVRAYGTPAKFDLHGTTFSGNAFGCRAALESLRLTSEWRLPERAERLGERFLDLLRARLAGHPLVRDVRGIGLLVAVELGPSQGGLWQRLVPGAVSALTEEVLGQWLAVRLLEAGIVCHPASQQWNVLRLEPPLVVSEREVERAVAEVARVLGDYTELGSLAVDVFKRLGEQYRAGWAFR